MHVTASGAIDWAVQAGGADTNTAGYGIAHDGAGGALVTGDFDGKASFGSTSLTSHGQGSCDAFVMHVTASGSIDWALQAGGASVDQGWGIAHDGAGGALVTGYFSGHASFGSTLLTSHDRADGFVMHVTASGAIDWAVGSSAHPYAIAHDGVGGALVTGYFSGNASFGSTTLTSLGIAPACFVASLMPPLDRPPLLPPPPPAPLPPPPGSPPKSSRTPDPRGVMALSEQPAFVVSLATSLALLALLLACVYRRHYRRLADNFRVSLDRRELDLQCVRLPKLVSDLAGEGLD
jgi:hypothetical protein